MFQRFIEIWNGDALNSICCSSSHRYLYPDSLCCLASSCCFHGCRLVGLVRAEFLRARNLEYIQAPRSARRIEPGHHVSAIVLPNAMVATHDASCRSSCRPRSMTLTALDFLGFGLPPGSPSLGELLSQAKANIQAPWLGISGFFTGRHHALAADLHRWRRCAMPSIRARSFR